MIRRSQVWRLNHGPVVELKTDCMSLGLRPSLEKSVFGAKRKWPAVKTGLTRSKMTQRGHARRLTVAQWFHPTYT